MDLIIISKRILAIGHIDGYFARYLEHCPTSKNYKDAYLKTEKEFLSLFGMTRYKSYSAFRKAKCLWLKKQKLLRKEKDRMGATSADTAKAVGTSSHRHL